MSGGRSTIGVLGEELIWRRGGGRRNLLLVLVYEMLELSFSSYR